ncbi:MAG: hypothetical protein E7466_06675 [Ruminococcaceae bacterium]|nr:hypothetical protein [Oscillospiraceae bacterium]
MKTKKWITILTAVLLLASVAGCAASGETGPDTPAATVNSTAPLSAADAQKLALEHAQLTADKVTGLRTEYDLDDGVPEYEVDFRQGDYEYDYTIHAETGKVLHWDKEFDPVDPKPTKPAEPQTPTTAPVKPEEPAPEKLTADDAKKIALDHAGLTADKVTGLRAKYDVDDGVPTYEVEFYADGWEYDYEIHAEIGKILEWDKDD